MNRTEPLTDAIGKNSLAAASLREISSVAELCLFAIQRQPSPQPGFPDIAPALLRIVTEIGRVENLIDQQETLLRKVV